MTLEEALPDPDPNLAELAEAAELCAGDPRAEREARQLKALRESEESVLAMQAILLEMARLEAQRQLQSEDFPERAPPNNRLPALGRAHAAVTRMLHKNIEEENRIDDARLDRLAGVARELKARRREAAEQQAVRKQRIDRHLAEVRYAVEGMIEAEVGEDQDRADGMLKGLYRSLDQIAGEDSAGHCVVSELAARICKDLGFTPDWDAWADEDWAQDDMNVEGSPYGPEPRIVQDEDGRYRFSSQRPASSGADPP